MFYTRYSSYFKNLPAWCYRTAVFQFVIFLSIFLAISYLSTLIDVDYSKGKEFPSKYGKYIVLAISLYMIVPFAFSNIFLFGLLHKHQLILSIYIKGTIGNCVLIFILTMGSGIYLAVEGPAYIGYSLICVCLLLDLFLIHGILLALGVKDKFLNGEEEQSNASSESDVQM